jgi:hypothetical protein
MSYAGLIARTTGRIIAYIFVVCKFERQRPKRRWEDDIKTDPKETICEGVEAIHLAQDGDQWWGLVNVVIKDCGL